MITEVLMKRELMGGLISQKSKSEFLSATDLEKIGNKYRIANDLPIFDINGYFRNKSTIEFMELLKEKYGEIKITSKGKNGHTFVHPLVFIDLALTISPKLKIEVYEWLFDSLIKYRNESGDSYKEMAGYLYIIYPNKKEFVNFITSVANQIKLKCDVKDWNLATEYQLKQRDNIHLAIKLYSRVIKNPHEIVRLSLI